MDRSLGLDPMGPSGMLSLDVYNQPRAVGPVDKPSRPGPTAHPHTVDAPDWPTAGGPMDRLLSLDPMGPSGMISLDGYNQPPAMGHVGKPSRPGPGDHPGSKADCGQMIQLRSESEGANDVPDPVIQTGSDVRTDRVGIGAVHGQTGSCDTPPSSDSGVHSLEEQWENMSTESLDTTSEQTEGGPEQLDGETSGPMKTETAVRVYIANISDFSDSDDQTQEEIRPGTRTGSDRCDSIGIVSEVCDRPVANTVTAKDDRDSLDPNDREYWTKFRLLTKQAFLLDDDCLSDSNFPEAVKDVVKRSRLTMMALDEYDAPPFDQRTNDETPDCSDGEDNRDSDDSDDEYGTSIDHWKKCIAC